MQIRIGSANEVASRVGWGVKQDISRAPYAQHKILRKYVKSEYNDLIYGG